MASRASLFAPALLGVHHCSIWVVGELKGKTGCQKGRRGVKRVDGVSRKCVVRMSGQSIAIELLYKKLLVSYDHPVRCTCTTD